MNILYLTSHLNIGGITSYVLSLAKGMKLKGHNIYIASYGGQCVTQFTEAGIAYLPIPIKTKSEASPKILVSLLKLLKYIKDENIDIIHSNTRVTQVLGFLVNRICNMPYISTCHGFFKKRFFRKIFPCWGIKVIAISEAVKEHLHKDFKVGLEDIRLINSGVDVQKFTANNIYTSRVELKKKLGLGVGQVIGIIARLSEEKGHIYLIEAMKIVLEKIPDAQLLIVGEGRLKKDLLKLCKRLRIEENIFFVSQVFDTAGILPIMDLFVMPSLKEGLGLGLMEAMASGRPVIATDVGGISSLIQDGYNGVLIEPQDAKQLSEAILEFLKDEQKRKYLGKNAQNFISQNFYLEKMVSQTETVYLECLGEKH